MFFFDNAGVSLKRYLGLFLASVLSFFSLLGINADFQGVYKNNNSTVTYSFYDSTKKVLPSEYLDKNASYDIYLARNETEACQIIISGRKKSSQNECLVEFSEFTNENGHVLPSTIYQEHYISNVSNKDYGSYPDALTPISSRSSTFAFMAQMNIPFYIQVQADEGTPAGKYTAEIVVHKTKDNSHQFTAEVTATVWDFQLPETPTMDTAFGLGRNYINKVHGTHNNPELSQQLFEKYYEYLLERKISPYYLPVDILSDEADAYMSDPRVKSFIIPYPADDALLQEYYAKVTSNPDWAAKGYFYPIDEPSKLEDYARYNVITERLDRLCPGYNLVTPFGGVSFKENGQTYHGIRLQAKSNIVCPITTNFSSSEFLNLVDERRADGSKVWWYICCVPGPNTKYANIFTQSDGIEGRLLMWQQKSFDVTGLLYWETVYWNKVPTPWVSAWTTPWTGQDTFGDGSLFYPGPDGPLSSLRLEYVSDGIEDYEYLTIAEELFGRDYVDKKISKVTSTLEGYTRDDSLLAKVRVEIGNDIEAELAK